jgi:CRISPR-associated protein Cas4
VDTQSYSTSSQILQWISVFSEQFGLNGKIDLFHIDKKSLLERKKLIKKVHPGYILQMHAQYYCLSEMWYDVQTLKLYSLDDNRVYPIDLPTSSDTASFSKILEAYRSFDPDDPHFSQNSKKCAQCIYRELCDYYLRTHW